MLRCIHCGRGTNKVTLSPTFRCVDEEACATFLENKHSPKKIVSIYFDAACLGANTKEGQPLGLGVYTTIDDVHAPEYCGTKAIAWGTNNDGEYQGLICALGVAIIIRQSNPNYVFRIYGDSKLVIDTVAGKNRVSSKFKKYVDKIDKSRLKLGASLHFIRWIPREQNQEADNLSKQALLEHQ